MFKDDRKWILENAYKGLITSEDVTNHGIHRSTLSRMVKNGDLIKIERGIYLLAEEWVDEFSITQVRYKRGIYSHNTSLYLQGYSERVPLKLHMTFPTKYNSQSLKDENVEVTRVNDSNYELGLTEIKTPAGNYVKAYDLERSLCDVLRGSGDDIQVVQYAMKKYASSKTKNVNKLMKYAKQLHVEKKVQRYLEVLL